MTFDRDTLDQIILARQAETESGEILGMSGDLTLDDALIWQGVVALDPMPTAGAVGVFPGRETGFVLARTWLNGDSGSGTLTQLVDLPRPTYSMMAGNVSVLLSLIADGAPSPTPGEPLPPVKLPPAPTWTADKRLTLIDQLVKTYGNGRMETVFALLGALLHERRLLIRGFPADLQARLNLVQGLLLLLPSAARTEMTFATNVISPDRARTAIAFCDQNGPTTRWVADFAQPTPLEDDDLLQLPYVRALLTMWHGDVREFVAALRAMELLAGGLMNGQPAATGLDLLASRLLLDAQVRAEVPVEGESIKAVLTSDMPPDGALFHAYVGQLLRVALRDRDTEAVALLAGYMAEAEMYDLILRKLESSLNDEPDATYFFLRTYLNTEQNAVLLPLLHTAVVLSLQIVIADADAETVMTWLKLIAREPAAFQLGDVLRDGIRAAGQLATADGMLGRRLLSFTARRAPDLLETLLDDEDMIAVLEAPVGPALRTFDPAAVIATRDSSVELALILFSRALVAAPYDEAAAAVFSGETVDRLWALAHDGTDRDLPQMFQPMTLIDALIESGGDWLEAGAVAALLRQAILSGDATLLTTISTRLIDAETRFSTISTVVQGMTLPPDHQLQTVQTLLGSEIIGAQQAVDFLLALAGSSGWQQERADALVEQVARMIQQQPALVVPFDSLQRMLEVASAARSEVAVRAIIRRMLAHIETLSDEAQQLHNLAEMDHLLAWSANGRGQILNWWRGFARTLPISRLQQIERLLSENKAQESARGIVQTALSVRRMLGNRSLEDFADSVATAYTVLQAIYDSFDNQRQVIGFDEQTIYAEFEAREAELTPDERSVLAKNLMELADLIIDITDKRKRNALIRRPDTKRQRPPVGEAPQGALDAMRWISDYLSGAQEDRD